MLKFWTMQPPLHPPSDNPVDRLLSRDGGVIYAQTRERIREIIDLHLDGHKPYESSYHPGTILYEECPGCPRTEPT